LEKTGDALGVLSGRVEGDLAKLKRFPIYERERGRETGGWRSDQRRAEPYPNPAQAIGTGEGFRSGIADRPHQPENEVPENIGENDWKSNRGSVEVKSSLKCLSR
jgi:hypothetical protein